MKLKATKKEMKASYNTIIGIGYCKAQHLLEFENAIAYSCGANGWDCDYYEIDNVLISTGYSHISSNNASPDYEIIKRYNDEAMKICCDYSINWEKQKELVKNLLNDFIMEVTK